MNCTNSDSIQSPPFAPEAHKERAMLKHPAEFTVHTPTGLWITALCGWLMKRPHVNG